MLLNALLVVLVASAPSSPLEEPAARGVLSAQVRGDETSPVPVPTATPKALRYYHSGNRLWAIRELWSATFLAALLFSGASARLRDLARRLGRSWFLTIAIYVALYGLIEYAVTFPLAYYAGYLRQHAYGLSNQSFNKWFSDSLKNAAISAAVGSAIAWVPYLLIARSPRRWWLYTSGLSVPFLFAVMLLKPIWVDPLFNTFGPMHDKALEARIIALARRCKIDAARIYEVDKSVDTKSVNAYVTGLLGTHRIVLWDTLLAKLDEREVLAVMGHEMGHYVLGHVFRSIVLSALITLAGLFWVDRAGRWLIARTGRRLGFESLADIASLPLLLLLVQLSSLVLEPVANAYSRYQEHEADRFSLELTGMNRSTALAFAKLQQENLSNPRPGWFYRLWRSTHPSIAERIEFSNAYHPWREGRPLRYGGRFQE